MGTPRVIFVHGMGEKPEPEAERRRMWAPLEPSLWTPIPYDAFVVAYWADPRQPQPDAPARKPSPALLRSLPARQRAGLGCHFWLGAGGPTDPAAGRQPLPAKQAINAVNDRNLARWDLPYRYGSRLFVPTASLHVAVPAVLFLALGLVDAFILMSHAGGQITSGNAAGLPWSLLIRPAFVALYFWMPHTITELMQKLPANGLARGSRVERELELLRRLLAHPALPVVDACRELAPRWSRPSRLVTESSTGN